jgi:hypothetical protein
MIPIRTPCEIFLIAIAMTVAMPRQVASQPPLELFDAHLHDNQEPKPFYSLEQVLDRAASPAAMPGACSTPRPATDYARAACASTTAIAVMLTTPRAVTAGVRIWAGRAAPTRIGPTGKAPASSLII